MRSNLEPQNPQNHRVVGMRNLLLMLWLFAIYRVVLSSIGILASNYKDPNEPIRIMESRKGFERCSNVVGSRVPLISIDPLLIIVYMRIF